MEECLRQELLKLKEDEIYCEIGGNKKTIHAAFEIKNNIQIYLVDDEYACNEGIDDPCVRLNFLQGKSKDVCTEWFRETDESFISILLINEDFTKNFNLWHEYVKPRGIIIMNTLDFSNPNYKIERYENYLKISL